METVFEFLENFMAIESTLTKLIVIGTVISGLLVIFIFIYVVSHRPSKFFIILKEYSYSDEYVVLSEEKLKEIPLFKYKDEVISLEGLLVGVTKDDNEWYIIDPKRTTIEYNEKCILKSRVTKKYYLARRLNGIYSIEDYKISDDNKDFIVVGKIVFEYFNIKF